MLKYPIYPWGCSKYFLCSSRQEQMLRVISKGLYGKYDEKIYFLCDLVNTDNDTEKSPNIIDDYETAKKPFTSEYIFIWEKVRENTVS